jgi:hypothetical protein
VALIYEGWKSPHLSALGLPLLSLSQPSVLQPTTEEH